jgi:hypothetical protein
MGGPCDERRPLEAVFPGITAPDLHSPAAFPFRRAGTFSYRLRDPPANEPAAGLVDGGEEVHGNASPGCHVQIREERFQIQASEALPPTVTRATEHSRIAMQACRSCSRAWGGEVAEHPNGNRPQVTSGRGKIECKKTKGGQTSGPCHWTNIVQSTRHTVSCTSISPIRLVTAVLNSRRRRNGYRRGIWN